jgi:sialidase-1
MSYWLLPRYLAVLLLSLGTPAFAAEPNEQNESVVFYQGEQGGTVFRIPAITATLRGTLLAFSEARINGSGDSGDIHTVLKRSFDHGKTWSTSQVVADAETNAIMNPCVVVDRDTARIWLFLTGTHGSNTNEQNKHSTGVGEAEIFLTYSDDDGATWSQRENISKMVKPHGWTSYAVGPGCGIQLAAGRLVMPCNHRVPGKEDKSSIAHVIYSDDHGKNWKVGGSLEENTNESQVVELENGDLLMNMRSHHGRGRRAIATSKDRGETWSPVTFDEALIDPTCQASILRLARDEQGRVAFAFSNPASARGRVNMTVRLSYDNCKTWPLSKMLYEGRSAYSSLVALPGNRLGCLFETDRSARIVFVSFSIDAMSKAEIAR